MENSTEVMSESNQILMGILEQLRISSSDFQNSIVQAELIGAVKSAMVTLVMLAVCLYAFKYFNDAYGIVDNCKSALRFLFKKGDDNGELDFDKKSKKKKDSENKESGDKKDSENKKDGHKEKKVYFEDIMNTETLGELGDKIKQYFSERTVLRDVLSLFTLCKEISIVVNLLKGVVDSIALALMCISGPSKVVMDYLNTLFR